MTKLKWTFEACKLEALKYKTKKDFIKFSASAYGISCAKGWIDEIGAHLEQGGNRFKRFVYAYEFPENFVYVGLTYKISKRKRGHTTEGAVFEYIKMTNSEPTFKILTENSVTPDEAIKLEKEILDDYISDGWIPLNVAKTGSLGGNVVKWTFEKCSEKALIYKTRTAFCRAEGSAYSACLRNGWIDEVCKHMKSKRKGHGYWTFEKCRDEALKCKTKTEFNKKFPGGYDKACRESWLSDICSHMVEIKKSNNYYTFEVCKELVSKYTSFKTFRLENSVAYSVILLNLWEEDMYSNLSFDRKPNGYWTFERCMEAAKTCSSSKEYRKMYSTAYNKVCKNGWCDEMNKNFKK